MSVGRFVAGVGLAAGLGLATYLTVTKQDPRTWGHKVKHSVTQTKADLTDVKHAKDRVSSNVTKLTSALEDGTQALTTIQHQIEQFQFKIAPRVAAIEETVSHLENHQS